MPKAISPVAVALSEAGIAIEGLTLRTPTLDDVFLHVTGERMGEEAAVSLGRARRGFFDDLRSISLRAIRLTWRDPEAFLPALVIPVFFFVVNVGALQTVRRGQLSCGVRLQGIPTAGRGRLRSHRGQPGEPHWCSTSKTATSIACC